MTISFDNALGIHQQALRFRSQRAEVLANNLANADTPNFKARDLDFSALLAEQAAASKDGAGLRRTSPMHLAAMSSALADPALHFRNPSLAALDQNSVDVQQEQARYAENAVQFQASFTFLNSKFKGLMGALRGE